MRELPCGFLLVIAGKHLKCMSVRTEIHMVMIVLWVSQYGSPRSLARSSPHDLLVAAWRCATDRDRGCAGLCDGLRSRHSLRLWRTCSCTPHKMFVLHLKINVAFAGGEWSQEGCRRRLLACLRSQLLLLAEPSVKLISPIISDNVAVMICHHGVHWAVQADLQ